MWYIHGGHMTIGQQPEPEAADAPRGPPQFSLSNAEAIQRFRDQNRVVPESSAGGGGRLTVLSGGSSRQRPQTPQRDFTQQFEEPSTADDNFGDRNRCEQMLHFRHQISADNRSLCFCFKIPIKETAPVRCRTTTDPNQ